MTEQEWREWRQQVEHQETQTVTVRNGSRTWQVRWTWRGRGTRQVRIVRTEQRRVGWAEGQWQQVHGVPQCRNGGQTMSTVWE